MTLLVGNESEGTATQATPAAQQAHSFKFTASATGVVTGIKVILRGEPFNVTTINLAIQADNAGKPAEGVLCEATTSGSFAASPGTYEAPISGGPTLTSGTTYWLTMLSTSSETFAGGAYKYKPGTTTGRRIASVKHATIAAIKTTEWEAETTKGPAGIWVVGTESSGVTVTLSAASSTSAASAAATAQTSVALTSATSTSSASLTLQAATVVTLVSASSTSSGPSLTLTAATTVVLLGAPSTSASAASLTAATSVILSVGTSESSSAAGVTAATGVILLQGGSESAASATVTIQAHAVIIEPASAQSLSEAQAQLTAPTVIALHGSGSLSEASLILIAPTIPLGESVVVTLSDSPTHPIALADAPTVTVGLSAR